MLSSLGKLTAWAMEIKTLRCFCLKASAIIAGKRAMLSKQRLLLFLKRPPEVYPAVDALLSRLCVFSVSLWILLVELTKQMLEDLVDSSVVVMVVRWMWLVWC